MPITNYPNGFNGGVSILGAPILNTYAGNVYWLDSGHAAASDGNKGTDKNHPKATLDGAFAACTANNGDIIMVAPGHTEALTAAGAITADKAGVTVYGLGYYDAMPQFTFGADTCTALVTAANVTFHNIKFTALYADVAIAFHISAKGCRIDSCIFDESATDLNWVDVIHAGTADNDYDGLWINNCEIVMNDAAAVTAIDLLKNSADVKITNNRIIGDFDATPYAPIYMASTEVPTNILIQGNMIHNQHDGNAAVGIAVAATTASGWMVGNHVYALDVAGETPFLTGATGLYCKDNFYTYAGTSSGFEYPAIGTLA